MSNRSSTLTRPQNSVDSSQAASDRAAASTGNPSTMRLMKSVYQADQQVKLLHLQAEVESLLLELQNLKQQRLAPADQHRLRNNNTDNGN